MAFYILFIIVAFYNLDNNQINIKIAFLYNLIYYHNLKMQGQKNI